MIKNGKLVNFTATDTQLALINEIRKQNYLLNQSQVLRMIVDRGTEAILGGEACRRIEAQTKINA